MLISVYWPSRSIFLGLRIIAWELSGFESRKLSRYWDAASWPSCSKTSLTAVKLVPEVYNWWSYAYTESLAVVMEQGRSFWNEFQCKGPKEDPRGHPLLIWFHLLSVFSILTLFWRLWKNDSMRSNAEDSKPYASSFVSVSEWLRESNAL